MFCTSCDNEDKKLDVNNPICKVCGFDNSYVYGLVAEDDEVDVEDELRDSKSCAQRCVILYGVVAAAHGDDRIKIVSWLKEQKLWKFVSTQEQEFLESAKPTERQIVNATWRVEALHLLLWSLNKIQSTSSLSEMCNVEEIQSIFSFFLNDAQVFIESSVLRNEDEIDSRNELIYQAHWEVRDAQLNGKSIPDKLNLSVIKERHYAINWLTGYCGQEWDDITTDT
jgi:hypothetical protein